MRQVLFTGGALALSMLAAAYTWQHKDDKVVDASKVAAYSANKGDVQKITWTAEDTTVTVEHKKDEHGEYVWITTREVMKKSVPPAPEGDTDAAPAPEPTGEVKESAFLGNDAAQKLYDAFSPLMALRELSASGADPATFGFDAPKGTITIEKGGAPIEMVLGAETYGARDRYVKSGDKVFLVDDQELRPLQYGKTRLIERSLQPFTEKDIDTITVSDAAGAQVVFVQKNAADREKAYWARDTAPDVKDDIGKTWLDKLLKVRLQSYPPAAEIPATLVPVFTWSVAGRKDGASQTWTVEVLREEGSAPPEYYAKSSYDRATVKLTRTLAAEAVDDLAAALSGEAAPLPTDGGPVPPAPVMPPAHP